ncbi:MAG TPA: outer membrane protein transport protein [Steroidobacter sp.]
MPRIRARATRDLCFVFSLALVPPLANASGFALLEQSGSRLGSAFSGTAAAADDPSTVYFNPAGMTQLDGMQFALVASGVEITSELSNQGSLPALGQPLGGSGGDAGDWNLIPSGYFVVPLTRDLVFGFGVNAPFGLRLEYEPDWLGRFQAIDSEIETLNFNPSLALRVSDRVSIGIGVSYQRLQAELTNAVNYSAVIAQGVQQLVAAGQLPAAAAPGIIAANAGAEGLARVRGDDEAWGFNVGVTFDLTDATRIGLAYRSAIEYDIGGSIQFAAPSGAEPVGASIIQAVSASGGPLASGAAKVDLKLPDSAILSLRQRLGPNLDLLADVAWTGWSSLEELRINRDTGETVSVTPERWEDVWRYALGAAYRVNDAFTFRAGVAYDETPVPASTRTPRLPDPNRTWVAVGARWAPNDALMLDFGYAHLFSDDVRMNQDAGNVASSGLIRGEQSSDVDIISTQLTYRF